MSPFFLSWIGPVFLVSTVMTIALKNGHFDWKKEGLILFVFALQHIPKMALKFRPILWVCIYLLIFVKAGELLSLDAASCVLSSLISLTSLKEFYKRQKEHESNKKLASFFENRVVDSLKKLSEQRAKLDVFTSQNIEFSFESPNLDIPQFEDYNESLDEEEKQMSLEMKSYEKQEKKPLKRLRRIVMKQTSFFDEDLSTSD